MSPLDPVTTATCPSCRESWTPERHGPTTCPSCGAAVIVRRWKPGDDDRQPAAGGVVVTGISIPFGQVFVLVLQASIAAIPAMLIIGVLWFALGAVCAGATSAPR